MIEKVIKIIQEMYNNARTEVKTVAGNIGSFGTDIGLRHGSAFSPYFFAFAIDVLSEENRLDTLLKMLFSDDLVMAKIKEELQERVAT